MLINIRATVNAGAKFFIIRRTPRGAKKMIAAVSAGMTATMSTTSSVGNRMEPFACRDSA